MLIVAGVAYIYVPIRSLAHGAAVAAAMSARSREAEMRDGAEMETDGVGVAPRSTWGRVRVGVRG